MMCELLVARSKLVRQEVATALDGMIAEYERDMGAWQAEGEWLPRARRLTGAALRHGRRVLEGLVVYPERMRANLALTDGRILSEAVMLRPAGQVGRQEARDAVYRVVMAMHGASGDAGSRGDSGGGTTFAGRLAADPAVGRHPSPEAVAALPEPASYTGCAAAFAREPAAGVAG